MIFIHFLKNRLRSKLFLFGGYFLFLLLLLLLQRDGMCWKLINNYKQNKRKNPIFGVVLNFSVVRPVCDDVGLLDFVVRFQTRVLRLKLIARYCPIFVFAENEREVPRLAKVDFCAFFSRACGCSPKVIAETAKFLPSSPNTFLMALCDAPFTSQKDAVFRPFKKNSLVNSIFRW